MNGLKRIFLKIKKSNTLIFLLLLTSGLFFRSLYPLHVSIGFDQVQILENAEKILHSDITLIGPRTGPANMFTGPLIYYISVPFLYIFGDLNTVWIVPLFISFLTGLTIYLLLKKYFDPKIAHLSIVFWAFSPFIINLDRVFWNPNFTLLSSFLLITPLLSNKKSRLTPWVLLMGSFLSYQAHFSGIILVFLSMLMIIVTKKPLKNILWVLLGLLLSLIPTIVFDLKNNFLNLRGLLELVHSKSSFSPIELLLSIIKNMYIITETLGKIIFYNNSNQLIIGTGLFVLLLWIYLFRKERNTKMGMFIILGISLIYAVYSEAKPEYYFLILFPVFFFLLTQILLRANKHIQIVMIIFFIAISSLQNFVLLQKGAGLNIKNLQKIKILLTSTPIKNVSYDVLSGTEYGLQYVLRDLQYSESGPTAHISYPNDINIMSAQNIADIGVWFDNRDIDTNNITTKEYLLSSDIQYLLYKSPYPSPTGQDDYIIIENNEIIGKLAIIKQNKSTLKWTGYCQQAFDDQQNQWTEVKENHYVTTLPSYCIDVTTDKVTPDNLEIVLE